MARNVSMTLRHIEQLQYSLDNIEWVVDMYSPGSVINGIELLEPSGNGRWIGRCKYCYNMRIHSLRVLKSKTTDKCRECARLNKRKTKKKSVEMEMTSLEDNPNLKFLTMAWR